MPLVLINGAKPGPTLYLGSAIHGDEVNGVAIVSRVVSGIDPAALAGRVICVPTQNPLAFQVEHRVPVGLYFKSPLDQMPIDPWLSFPGNREGTVAERIAHRLFELIRACDYALDVHTPTHGGRYVPIAILPHPSLAAYTRVEAFAEAFGAGHTVKTDTGVYVRDGVLCVEATRAGVPAFTFEIGEGARVEEEVTEAGSRCVLNALRFLEMLPGQPRPIGEPRVIREFVGVRATKGGILRTEVPLGSRVRRGDVMARIFSVFGDEVETVAAPRDGLFVRMTTFPTVMTGDRVVTLGV